MSLIQIHDLTFAYEGSYDNVFEQVSFQFDSQWKLGLTGRNGRGKTTLLRLLMGELEYRGTIRANMEFAYFPYAVKDNHLTAKEIALSLCPQAQDWELLRELSLLEIEEAVLERPFATLSGGQRTKVLLAALFLGENRFLLIDEPTNHLDLEGRAALSRYLSKKQSYILVSHDRAFLDGCVDHILSINKADIQVLKGNFSTWWEQKVRQDAYEMEQNTRIKREVKRLEDTAREKARWSERTEASKIGSHTYDRGSVGHKAAKMMKRSKTIEARVERKLEETSALLKNLDVASDLKLWPLRHYNDTLARFDQVTGYYGNVTGCRDVSFTVKQGDRIALRGKNGCGKSTVLKLLAEKSITFTGAIQTASNLKISYVSQDTGELRGDLTDYAASYGIDVSLFKTILRKLGFRRDQFLKDMADFSGGQKKKVLIARSLCEKAHLYIWDEPLNYIDVLSRIQIEDLLLEYKPTLLFVEHDKLFCEKIATRIIALS